MNNLKYLAIFLFFTVNSYADQLILNDSDVSRKAVSTITPGSILIDYCSNCDDKVNFLRVIRAVYDKTDDNYVGVFAKKLYESEQVIVSGDFKESFAYKISEKIISAVDISDLYIYKHLDLSYTYVPKDDNDSDNPLFPRTFITLAEKVKLNPDVKVKQITISKELDRKLCESSAAARKDHKDNIYRTHFDYLGRQIRFSDCRR